MITRVEFIGFSVLGPAQRAVQAFKSRGADAWPKGWSCLLEGPQVILEGEGRRIEVPRARCVIYTEADVAVGTGTQPALPPKPRGVK